MHLIIKLAGRLTQATERFVPNLGFQWNVIKCFYAAVGLDSRGLALICMKRPRIFEVFIFRLLHKLELHFLVIGYLAVVSLEIAIQSEIFFCYLLHAWRGSSRVCRKQEDVKLWFRGRFNVGAEDWAGQPVWIRRC